MKILQKTILTNIFILLFISIASAESGQDWINAMDSEGYGQGFYHGFLSGWISG